MKKEKMIREIKGVLLADSSYLVSVNMKKNRKKLGITQAQLAKKINKTVEMVCQLENGVSSTKLSTLDEIAHALNVETYELLLRENAKICEHQSLEFLELIHDLEELPESAIKGLHAFVREMLLKNIDTN